MFSSTVHQDFKDHVLKRFPEEAGGFVVNVGGVVVFIPCDNISTQPDREYHVSGSDYVALTKRGEILAMLHSHVPIDGKDPLVGPSKIDMQLQIDMAMPFGISVTDGETCTEPLYFGEGSPRPPLVGRVFVSGAQDCLALLRDYFADHGVKLAHIAYDFDWFDQGDDLYATNFTGYGFHRIDASEVRVGDVALMKVGAKVLNHAGVVVEPGVLLHHLNYHLSMREPVAKWGPAIDIWLRNEEFKP
ncbi:tail assembly protein K [Rhizobium phage RHph_Y1_11]|nr:tail assembly protein K [Rhizobium phage RHph_Y1_11]